MQQYLTSTIGDSLLTCNEIINEQMLWVLCISEDKRIVFLRINDGNRYLTLFGSEKYDAIYNRIKYLIGVKSDITYVFLSLLRKA